MPCHAAKCNKVITVSRGDTVESVMKAMKKAKAENAVVIDEKGLFEGVCSSKTILSSLIPVSIAMADGVQLDIKVTAAPGVAKRYGNIKPLPVEEVMDTKGHTISPDSPIWEGVAHLTKYSEPLAVVDDKGKYFCLVTYNSMLEHLDSVMPVDG